MAELIRMMPTARDGDAQGALFDLGVDTRVWTSIAPCRAVVVLADAANCDISLTAGVMAAALNQFDDIAEQERRHG